MRRWIGLVLVALVVGCGEGRGADPDRRQWRLPAELAEISGLALDTDGNLLAHDDERGIVHTIDALGGEGVIGSLPLDAKVPKKDFEGIAVLGAHTYLITSKGELFDWTPERLSRTRLDPHCEVEGLTDYRNQLLAVCKEIPDTDKRRVRLLFINLDGPSIERRHDLLVDFDIRPSGIDWEAEPDMFYILAARPIPRVLSVDEDDAIRTTLLDPKRHPQPEGIAVVDDGWFIADEGKPGMLTWMRGRP